MIPFYCVVNVCRVPDVILFCILGPRPMLIRLYQPMSDVPMAISNLVSFHDCCPMVNMFDCSVARVSDHSSAND